MNWKTVWLFSSFCCIHGKVFDLWFKTKLLESRFDMTFSYLSEVNSVRFSQVVIKCENTDGCQLLCLEESGVVTLWKIRACPKMDESSKGAVKECYSRESKCGYIPNLTAVTIRGSGVNIDLPWRIMDNIIDGVYNYNEDTEYLSNYELPVYVVIDLGIETKIISIIVWTTPRSNDFDFNDIEVRIGTDAVPGYEFSSYSKVGYFSGPQVEDFPWTMDLPGGRLCRYISIQRMVGFQMTLVDVNIILE